MPLFFKWALVITTELGSRQVFKWVPPEGKRKVREFALGNTVNNGRKKLSNYY